MACPDCAAYAAGWDRAAAQLIEAEQRNTRLREEIRSLNEAERLSAGAADLAIARADRAEALNTPLVEERDSYRRWIQTCSEMLDEALKDCAALRRENALGEEVSGELQNAEERIEALRDSARTILDAHAAVTGTTSDSAPLPRQPEEP